MSTKTWQPIQVIVCAHTGKEVALEVELVYPPDFVPDQSPRVLAHRCTEALNCNLDGRVSCVWAGTNPAIDPFLEGK